MQASLQWKNGIQNDNRNKLFLIILFIFSTLLSHAQCPAGYEDEDLAAIRVTVGGVLTCTKTSTNLVATNSTNGLSYLWTGPGVINNDTSAIATVSTPGVYTLRVTKNATGCFRITTVNVLQDLSTPQGVRATASAILTCNRTTTNLSAATTTSNVTYLWTGPGRIGNASSPITAVATPGPATYTLRVTKASTGCFTTATVNVLQDLSAPEEVNAFSSAVLTCATTNINILAATKTTGVTYFWAGPGPITNANSAIATVSTPGLYVVRVTKTSTGCSALAAVNVLQDFSSPIGVSASSSAVLSCANPTVQLMGTVSNPGENLSYQWTGNSLIENANTPIASVSATGTYTLTVTNNITGCSSATTVNVTQDLSEPENVTATSSAVLTCSTTSTNLVATTNTTDVTYLWTGPGTITNETSATASVSAPGTYTLRVTKNSTGCFTTTTVDVAQDLSAPEGVTSSSSATLTCATTSTNLVATATTTGVTYLWTGPGTIANETSATASVSTPGTYTLRVTKTSTGCFTTTTVNVTQDITVPNRNIVATTGTTTLTCYTNALILTGTSTTPGATFRWTSSTSNYLVNTAVASISTPGTYSLVVTGPNGCVSTPLNRTISQTLISPIATASTTGSISCLTPSITLNGVSSAPLVTYSWTGPNGFTSTVQNPSVNTGGRYDLTLTTPSGCTGTATVNVVQDLSVPENVTATSSAVLTCATTSTNLVATTTTTGVTYLWTGPGTIANETSATASVSTPGTYTLRVTKTSTGCFTTTTLNVAQDVTVPNRNITTTTGTLTLTCYTNPLVLTGTSTTPGATFRWTSSTSSYLVNTAAAFITTPGIYSLVVTGPNGCSSTPLNRTVHQNVTPPIASASTTGSISCSTPSITLNGLSSVPSVTYGWAGPDGFTSTVQNPSVNAGGRYDLTLTTPGGCTSTATVNVAQDLSVPENVTATSSAVLTCATTSTNLVATTTTTGVTYLWTGPGTITNETSATASVSTPGTYTLRVTNTSTGCFTTTTVNVTQDVTIPNRAASGTSALTCYTNRVTLTGSSTTPGATFRWTSSTSSYLVNTAVASITTPGTYSLVVTGPNGCSSAPLNRNITQTLIPPIASASNTGSISCSTPSITLNGVSSVPTVTYGWTGPDGFTSTVQSPSVNTGGRYDLTITTPGGCTSTATVNVAQDLNVPDGVIATGIINCNDATVLLNATSTTLGVTYNWTGPNGFASSEKIVLAPSTGQYTVVVTNPVGGCTTSVTAQLIVDENCNSARISSNRVDNQLLIVEENSDAPLAVMVYPNPINSIGNMTLDATIDLLVTVELYSSMNIKVATLYKGNVKSGIQQTITFDTEELVDGVYLYRIIYLNKEIKGRLIINP